MIAIEYSSCYAFGFLKQQNIMSKDFRLEGRICFSKKPMGLGIGVEFNPPYGRYEVFWVFKIDLIFIRLWVKNESLHLN